MKNIPLPIEKYAKKNRDLNRSRQENEPFLTPKRTRKKSELEAQEKAFRKPSFCRPGPYLLRRMRKDISSVYGAGHDMFTAPVYRELQSTYTWMLRIFKSSVILKKIRKWQNYQKAY